MPADSTTAFILHADAASVLHHVKLDHESKRAGSSKLRPIRACLDPNKDTPAANNPKKIALVIQTTRNTALLAFVTAFSLIIQSTAIACTSTKNFGFKSRGTYSSVFGG